MHPARRHAWLLGVTALTALAFCVLHASGLAGDLPLPLLLTLLVGVAAFEQLFDRLWGTAPNRWQLQVLLAVQIFGVTAVMYAIGYGPMLAIGYVFVIANALETYGPRTWRPALGWMLLGMGAGQVFVALGWTTSYLDAPYVHGFAGLSALGTAFVVYLLGVKTEVQHEGEARLREGESSFRQLFADNPQPMYVVDLGTLGFLEVNAATVAKYGYTRDEFLALKTRDIRPPEDDERAMTELAAGRATTQRSAPWRHALKDGRIIDVELDSHALIFEGHQAVLVAVQDVTERNRLEAALRHRAFHDPLTGLANRALFIDRIDHAISRLHRSHRGAAVFIVDLDRFKNVNDSLGHNVGDELLVEVATRLRGSLREGDTPARLGGDEFAVLLEDLDAIDDAEFAAQRLISTLTEPFRVGGMEVFVGASIGISVVNVDGVTSEELLRNADAAMYRAKVNGNEYRFFESEMHVAAVARIELESDLRHALFDRQLILHYQPIVSLDTQRVVSVEALVRWQHPARGLLMPNEFVPLAEENGLIVDIGRWVLREACAQAQAWRAVWNEDLCITVNVSRRQLNDVRLVDDVKNALRASRLDAHALTLEITESALFDDTEVALHRLRMLKELGVKIAIDDFGTGYSSLSSLQSLPVDTLKIDKSFIDGIANGTTAAGVVNAIVGLAETLELETIAEGVEHPDQLERLVDLGCSHIQGFCYSRPLPAADAAKLLDNSGAVPVSELA
jgi:diguanylate cyclase (GGDEF)-like protein/PAS domain S-box-containing protein